MLGIIVGTQLGMIEGSIVGADEGVQVGCMLSVGSAVGDSE